MTWREAGAIGILMNTRGLMELVVLNIGFDIGVISPALFTMMVLMALVTTFLTTPVLEWIYPVRPCWAESTAVAQLGLGSRVHASKT
jgi:Kef-type K+ transport system membrane component KefB